MDKRVFYGLLGVIAAVWVGLYFFLVQPARQAADAAQVKLSRHATSASRYAKKEPEKLPTDELRDQVAREATQTSESVDRVRQYYLGRDAEFERYLGGAENPTPGQWRTSYKDVFDTLEEDYTVHADKLRVGGSCHQ